MACVLPGVDCTTLASLLPSPGLVIQQPESLCFCQGLLGLSGSQLSEHAPQERHDFRRGDVQLLGEDRFRILKDFLHLRPVYHWTEPRVRGHIAVCVYASLIDALILRDLRAAHPTDPDLPEQDLSAARALRELQRIRRVNLQAGQDIIQVVTRRNPLQTGILTALGVDTRHWDRAHLR